MKRIIAKSTLREFWGNYPSSEQYLKTWYDTAKKAKWLTPNDVKQIYGTASILKNGRVVFNIKGNTYRLVVKFNYEKQNENKFNKIRNRLPQSTQKTGSNF